MTEILAPAGDEKSAYAAINSGADAIYLGLSAFSARSNAANFSLSELEKLVAHAHLFGVKIYVAMNTLVKQSELEEFIKTAVAVHNAGADAIIIQDIFLGAYLKRQYPQLTLHLSTQAGICNAYGAEYAKRLGFSRVILARETALKDIREIAKIIETEVFVQGALCTCFSGQCYLSSFAGGNSGNRGKCKQPCRKRYKIDRKGFDEYAYRISLSDLSVGHRIEELVAAGVSSFKIEGRMRRPEYVAAAVAYCKKSLSGVAQKSDFSALKRTYNRGNYTSGLAFGQDKSFISSAVQGHIGEYLGTVSVENGKYICRTKERCGEGDGFKILRGGNELCGATYGGASKDGFFLKCSVRLKAGDKVFITTDVRLNAALLDKKCRYKVEISARFSAGERPVVRLNGREFTADFYADEATGRPLDEATFKTCFDKVDVYPFEIVYAEIDTSGNAFVPASKLNAFRRAVYENFYADLTKITNKRIVDTLNVSFGENCVKNNKTAVIAEKLGGVKADVGILKPSDYNGDIFSLCEGFEGEKYLYLPPFLTGEEIKRIKGLITPFDGIYCGGNYAVPLSEELNKPLFAGVGFNIFNALSLEECPAKYVALSKELTRVEAQPLSRKNTFYLTAGGIKVMDLIYCPFGRSCQNCDMRGSYTLTDESGRVFPLRRYKVSECRFEIYNCAALVAENNFTGVLADLTGEENPAALSEKIRNPAALKNIFGNYTRGHSESPVL